MKRFASFFIFCLCTTGLLYAEPLEISLWNGNPPSDNGLRGEETYNGTYYANVTQAALFVFQPETPNGLAILACPGGSYNTLWTNHELTDLAEWFTSRGVVFAMLKYRLPNGHPTIPLEDVQQAMKLMRAHRDDWHFTSLGVMGRSAGGHLAAMASTMFTDDTNRPDFQILFYPVITCETPNVHMDSRTSLIGASPSPETIAQYSLEQHVTSRTPKAFITHSADDRMVPAANSILYFNELVRNGVPASLHIYPRGGHGWCMDASFAYTEAWTHELDHWLKQLLKEQNRR